LPARHAALGAGNDMVERKLLALPTVLAGEAVAQENVEPGESGEARRLHVALQRHDRGQPHLERGAPDQRVVFGEDVDPIEEHRLDRVLPAPDRQGIVAQRPKVRIQHESRAVAGRQRLNMNSHENAPYLHMATKPDRTRPRLYSTASVTPL